MNHLSLLRRAGYDMRADLTAVRHRAAWYSAKGPVHHNHPRCMKGALIGLKNRRPGDRGKPLCSECQVLERDRRLTAARPRVPGVEEPGG